MLLEIPDCLMSTAGRTIGHEACRRIAAHGVVIRCTAHCGTGNVGNAGYQAPQADAGHVRLNADTSLLPIRAGKPQRPTSQCSNVPQGQGKAEKDAGTAWSSATHTAAMSRRRLDSTDRHTALHIATQFTHCNPHTLIHNM